MLLKSYFQIRNHFQIPKITSRFYGAPSTLKLDADTSNEKTTDYTNAIPYSAIPGPSALSLILSNFPGGKFYQKDFREIIRMYRKQYGDLMKMPSVFGKPEVIISHNPDHFQTVFRTEGQWPSRLGLETVKYYRDKVRPDIYKEYKGLVSTDGEEWGKFRKAVNPIMIQPKNTKLYVPIIDEVASDFLNRIRKIRNPTTNQLPENFENDINRWALESIGVIALDTRLGLISDTPNERAKRFTEAVKDFIELTYILDFQPSVWRFISTPTFKKFLETMNTMTDIAGDYIKEAKSRLQKNQRHSKQEREESVIEKLLKINENIATIMAMDMFFAGVDTTSSALTGVLYLLTKNPDKQEILRKEIRSVLPNKDSSFNIENMRHLPYLRGCIKESQRLLPTVIGNIRCVGQDLVLDGYQIPKGTSILMSGTPLILEEKYYEQASKFMPERWLKQETSQGVCPASAKSTHSFVYLPFGFGPRMCIGRRFAEMEIEILISKIVRNFNVTWDMDDLKYKIQTINIPDAKLMFTLVDLED